MIAGTVKKLSGEIIQRVDAAVNRWNGKYLAEPVEDVKCTFYTRHPESPDHGPGYHDHWWEEDALLLFQAWVESRGWGVLQGPVVPICYPGWKLTSDYPEEQEVCVEPELCHVPKDKKGAAILHDKLFWFLASRVSISSLQHRPEPTKLCCVGSFGVFCQQDPSPKHGPSEAGPDYKTSRCP